MTPSSTPAVPAGTALFEARSVSKRFGALVAVDRVSVALHTGEIHAVIGTNFHEQAGAPWMMEET